MDPQNDRAWLSECRQGPIWSIFPPRPRSKNSNSYGCHEADGPLHCIEGTRNHVSEPYPHTDDTTGGQSAAAYFPRPTVLPSFASSVFPEGHGISVPQGSPRGASEKEKKSLSAFLDSLCVTLQDGLWHSDYGAFNVGMLRHPIEILRGPEGPWLALGIASREIDWNGDTYAVVVVNLRSITEAIACTWLGTGSVSP